MNLQTIQQNKSFTDVTFVVGPAQHSKKFVAHRVLLAMTSPVFEAMFYGDMADKGKYVRVPDVAPVGFENLLRFAYTDCLKLANVEDAMMTAYAAKKYLLPQLLRECLGYIELHLTPGSACVVFEFAHVLNSQQLVLQAMNLIDRQTSQVIQSKSFAHVQASTVEFVANRRYLNLEEAGSEAGLFRSLLNWTQAEARRRGQSPSDWLQLRSIMTERSLLRAARFLAMSAEQFAELVCETSAGQRPGPVDVLNPSRLLTGAEQRAVLLNLLAGPESARLPSSLNTNRQARRPPPPHFTLSRFEQSTSTPASLATTSISTRSLRQVSAKFQCLSENVFLVALTIPIRLDASSYANRTPKLECHLKFSTRPAGANVTTDEQDKIEAELEHMEGVGTNSEAKQSNGSSSTALVMDTIDESLSVSIARDADCLVRLKRPLLIKHGNINELTLSFQSYALDEELVALRAPRGLRASPASLSEQTDSEGISWLFFKTPTIVEFSELHYYY